MKNDKRLIVTACMTVASFAMYALYLDENNGPVSTIDQTPLEILKVSNTAVYSTNINEEKGMGTPDAQFNRGPNKRNSDTTPPPGHPKNPNAAWKESVQVPERYKGIVDKHIDRRFIQYDSMQFSGLAPGDSLTLYIPQTNEKYISTVEQVKNHPNGDKTISSTFTGPDGEIYTATITHGENSLYATISTPSDVYFLQGNQKEGWIISSKDQDALVSWTEDDIVHPPSTPLVVPPPQ